jgi:hypothetical protein
MQLKDFIRETLTNITQGVEEANGEGGNRFQLSNKPNLKGISGTGVDFEVSVVATDSQSEGGNAGFGIKVASLFNAGVGMDSQEETSNQIAHTLRFQVFIAEK